MTETVTMNGEWGKTLSLEPGRTLSNELGHLRLWMTLLHNEWQLRSETITGQVEEFHWNQTVSFVVPSQDKTLKRYIRAGEQEVVTFRPALADLPMVIRPFKPVYIAPDSACTIYVSTVVWMQVCVGDEQRVLTELPVMKPSWTWVGKNTMEGELCYATQTFARMAVEALPRRPWRAITPVHISNQQKEPLFLERISVPVPLLSLYLEQPRGDKPPCLWTPALTVTCERDLATASVDIDRQPPTEAGVCERIAEPRKKPEKGGLVQTLDRLFG